MVSQSTSGDVPESGLDVLNQDGDSRRGRLAGSLSRSDHVPMPVASGSPAFSNWPFGAVFQAYGGHGAARRVFGRASVRFV